MTVKFQRKNDGKVIVHDGVSLMTTESVMFGVKGYYLGFEDGTCCLVSKQSFALISVSN